MSKDIEMKQHVLEMLRNFMLGSQGKKFKPKAIEVEMVGKKSDNEDSLKDVLDKASEERSMDDEDEGSNRSLKDYFKRK